MTWQVRYTNEAREDLKEIYEYIAFELLVPDIAERQYNRIMQSVKGLNTMPRRYPLYHEEPWHSLGVRWFPVDNYIVLYYPDETKATVYIVRIMYERRDIKRHLMK